MPHPQQAPVLEDDRVVRFPEQPRHDIAQPTAARGDRLAGEVGAEISGEGAGGGVAQIGRLLQALQRD